MGPAYRKAGAGLLLPVLLAALLCGCQTATHITREDQLAHITTALSSQDPTAADTTAGTADTVLTEAVTTIAGTRSAETSPPETTGSGTPTTKATSPKKTDPPQTDAGETLPATEPDALQTEPAAALRDPYDISGYTCGSLEYAILDAINASRQEAELDALTLGSRLSAIASVRAYESSVSFSHTRPDGTDCFTVLSDYGYGCSRAAENLLQCSSGYTGADMVGLWMDSKGHRANILDPDVSVIGIGVYRENGITYVATLFTD